MGVLELAFLAMLIPKLARVAHIGWLTVCAPLIAAVVIDAIALRIAYVVIRARSNRLYQQAQRQYSRLVNL